MKTFLPRVPEVLRIENPRPVARPRLVRIAIAFCVGWELLGCRNDVHRKPIADATVVTSRDGGFDSGADAARDAAQEAGADGDIALFVDASKAGDAEPGPQTDASLDIDDAGYERGTHCYEQILRGATLLSGSTAAIQGGVEYLSTQSILIEAHLVLDYFYRAFGVEPFADALDKYDELLQAGTSNDGYYRVLRRIADPENVYETGDWSTLSDFDPITMHALYCREQPLPEGYLSELIAFRDAGGYNLTHVGLALIFLEDNSCSMPFDADFRRDVESRMAAIPDRSDGLDDLEIEAIAFLLQLRRADLVDRDDLRQIASSALLSGGWGVLPDNTVADWHTTELGLWSLFLYECPEARSPLAAQAGDR